MRHRTATYNGRAVVFWWYEEQYVINLASISKATDYSGVYHNAKTVFPEDIVIPNRNMAVPPASLWKSTNVVHQISDFIYWASEKEKEFMYSNTAKEDISLKGKPRANLVDASKIKYVETVTHDIPEHVITSLERMKETVAKLSRVHRKQRRSIDALEFDISDCVNVIKQLEQSNESRELLYYDCRTFADVEWGVLAKINNSCKTKQEKTKRWQDLGAMCVSLSEEMGIEMRSVPVEPWVLKKYDYLSKEKGAYRIDVLEAVFFKEFGPPLKLRKVQ